MAYDKQADKRILDTVGPAINKNSDTNLLKKEHFKAVVLLLLIHCLVMPHCGGSVFGPCCVMQF